MPERYAITALKAKRAELAGELDELERERAALKTKLVHIDQSLKMLGFNGNPVEIKLCKLVDSNDQIYVTRLRHEWAACLTEDCTKWLKSDQRTWG